MKEADPFGMSQHDSGAKLDKNKKRVWLMMAGFANALESVSAVTTKGAEKYTPNGWVNVPNAEERYMDAFGRHLLAYGKGEIVDTDTGCLHLSQMVWNLLAVLELQHREAKRSSHLSALSGAAVKPMEKVYEPN